MENVRRIMARNVYTGNAKYSTLHELNQVITDAWEKIPQSTLCHSSFESKRCSHKVLNFCKIAINKNY